MHFGAVHTMIPKYVSFKLLNLIQLGNQKSWDVVNVSDKQEEGQYRNRTTIVSKENFAFCFT